MDSDLVAQLTSAIQRFVLHRTPPEEGTMIEARQLADRWKLGGQCLFDSSTPNLTVLLAAVVVLMKRDCEHLKLVRQYRSDELDKLIKESDEAEVEAIAAGWSTTQASLTARQQSERKRRKWNRDFRRSIEYQFGGGLQADDYCTLAVPIIGLDAYKKILQHQQTCLDTIFAGESVNMLRLEELFWMDRRRFAKAVRGLRTGRFNYLGVVKIMDFLLKEKRRAKSKRSKPGRSPRLPWLYDQAVRVRVLTEIEARMNTLPIETEIASTFLAVIRSHLSPSGKK